MARPTNFSREADKLREILEEAYEQTQELLRTAGDAVRDPILQPHYKTLVSTIQAAGTKLELLRKIDSTKNTPMLILDKDSGKLFKASKDQVIKIARDYDVSEHFVEEL